MLICCYLNRVSGRTWTKGICLHNIGGFDKIDIAGFDKSLIRFYVKDYERI